MNMRHKPGSAAGLALVAVVMVLGVGSRSAYAASRVTHLAFYQQWTGSGAQLSLGQQLVKETRETDGDEKAEFKQSGSVRLLSNITGLDVQHSYWLSTLLNFAVVVGVIVWISRKTLPATFRSRSASIQKAMEEARKVSAEANRRLAGIESRLAKLDTEIGEIRAAAEQEAAAEEQRIRLAAAEDARRLVESAEQEIAAAAKAARRELTAYTADLAVAFARRQIHVDAAADQALVQDLVRQLPGNGDTRKDGR